jgi:hypothetical protein
MNDQATSTDFAARTLSAACDGAAKNAIAVATTAARRAQLV